ncbi:MAG TPA: twin-arginine translocase TatA/TatE family subunit [Candidatus Limnocylindrales bacterium]|jgi:sec-independent protein translocase protein TatA
MPFNIGPFELLIVLVLALLILGPGKLPEVGNALGKTIREFRKASSDVEEAVRIEPAAAPATAKPVNTVADTTDTAAEDRTAS